MKLIRGFIKVISMKVNVLGTDYEIIEGNEEQYPGLEGCDGFTDPSVHQCIIEDMKYHENDKHALADLELYKKKVIRHELIHAFLEESGLSAECEWARNEELVDWFAVQSPKIFKAYVELGLIEGV